MMVKINNRENCRGSRFNVLESSGSSRHPPVRFVEGSHDMSAFPRFRRTLLLVASISLCILSSIATANAQRLPSDVVPEHYKLILTPDLKTATFAGREEIVVKLSKPLTAITLNAFELKFLKVTTQVGGVELPATVSLDSKNQQATLTFPKTLSAGT